MNSFFGKYRGKVTNNLDPEGLGRLQIEVPAVLGEGQLSWAMPCVPYGGPGVGFFAIPPVDANIWVEFEAGDTNHPIWSGCFWSGGEAPNGTSPGVTLIQTDTARLRIDDASGSLTVETDGGAKLVFNSAGVGISNGQGSSITLEGLVISLNQGALEVE